ncbi:hypothetical protein [Aliiroseovarius sp.]
MRDSAEFDGAPWKSVEIEGFAATAAVPTMLADEEQALYAC